MGALLMLAVLGFAVPDRPDPGAKNARPLAEDLLGDWRVIRRVNAGKDDVDLTLTLVFTRETMQHVRVTKEARSPGQTFPYLLDARPDPAVIRFRASKFTGILKIEGDLLTLCLHPSADDRPPPGFESPPGTAVTILQAMRVKN